ncbi:MAG: aminopeptidase P family protein [Acidimicrobiia bacterium]|nr:aminopeptidase P family protein [Acidimicrobiia bacterium]
MNSAALYTSRIVRVRAAMREQSVDALLVSVGHDLPYLVGYHAMPLERLTALVVTSSKSTLLVPRLEAPRVEHHASVFDLVSWDETQDPVAIVASLLLDSKRIAVGDQMWSRFLVDLLRQLPGRDYVRSVDVVGPLRASKDDAEIAALAAAGAAADRVAAQLQRGEIPLVGRTEAEVSADISARLLAEGHDVVNFAIVAAGENAASPHHHPGRREIRRGEIVLCDFGGTMNGYCSDITRCVHLGAPPADVQRAWSDLQRAQEAGVQAGVVGGTCESVDAAARGVLEGAGWGDYFIHRTGHGIGMEAHEEPYMVRGNVLQIAHGHAFSVEPGIYVSGKWGMRLEDIVVATTNGPQRMNHATRDLVVL